MSFTNRITWETLRSIDSATLTGSYQAVGTPLTHQSYIFKMVNNSTSLVTVSIDGSTDIDVLPASSFFLYDENEGNQAQPALPAGTQIFVKGGAGTGLIYVINQYLILD
jgi:hypothetical protein